MDTSSATIWFNPSKRFYIFYSPADGVDLVLECYVGFWGGGSWFQSNDYQTIDDLEEVDSVHFQVVTEPALREVLFEGAVRWRELNG
ncbi:MAG: hypothetical protein CMF60_02485 [Magnetococcales bacterium]|nr:hypothetical protein [Magnetococcales bacterium]|tara:strand:+ start:209 stop:469 length:261 start_codon:yes stop_codon:yes gene_type:complete